jgi:hypothetical protein
MRLAALRLCLVFLLVGAGVASAQAAKNNAAGGDFTDQEDPQIFVSFLIDFTHGGTNVYKSNASGVQLLRTLDHGGGTATADAQGNLYVVQGDLDGSAYQVDTPVYMYADGSSQGTLLFTLKDFGAYTMTIDHGSFYIAGQVPESDIFKVVKCSPPDYKPEVLWNSDNQRFPTGISLDAQGNIFVGWLTAAATIYGPCSSGCIMEFPIGGRGWIVRLPNLAANAIGAGPVVVGDTMIFWAQSPGRFQYIEKVSNLKENRNYPYEVISFDQTLFPNGGNPAMAITGRGTELWGTDTGFGGPIGTNVVGIDLQSGRVARSFPVDSPSNIGIIMGIAVSPHTSPEG